MEALHSGAYRDTLGNSLYMPEHKIGSHSPDMMSQFMSNYYKPSNMAICATGVDHDEFVFQVQQKWGFTKDAPQVCG